MGPGALLETTQASPEHSEALLVCVHPKEDGL